MIKKGIVVTIIFIMSTFIQLISQIVVTRIFGAKLDLDIFLAAVAIPTILVTVIYGTLNDAFLPLYGEQRAKDIKNSDGYFISMLIIISIISFIIAWILGFFSNAISGLLYGSRGMEFVNNVSVQMSYMFYSIPASVIATLFGSYFYLHKHFNRFPIAQAVGSMTNLLIIVLLAPYIGIWSLVIAFVGNILFQIIFIVPPLHNFQGIKVQSTCLLASRRSGPARQVELFKIVPLLIAWVPLIIGNFAIRSDSLIIRSFGSSLPVGYLVYLNLISKIFILSTGMMTIGIQILQLPHLVEYFSNKQFEKAIAVINKSKIVSIGISVLVTLTVVLIAPIFIYLLFVGGKFTKHDADVTIFLLPFFVIPAIGWGINSVFMQPLIALKKQLSVGVLNILAFILSWIIATLVLHTFGALAAITTGLIILLGTGIIGSEILWQYYKQKLIVKSPS